MEGKCDDGSVEIVDSTSGDLALPLRVFGIGHESFRVRNSGSERTARKCVTTQAVCFNFPDGGIFEADFQLGQTVEVLKAFLAAELDIDMRELELEFDGHIMLDPLSLADFEVPVDCMEVFVLLDNDNWCNESKGK